MSKTTITFLNMTGDITIEWDAENAELVKAMVAKKMAEGYSFFVTKPRLLGLLGSKRVEVKDVSELETKTGAGSVVVPDALADKMIKSLDDADVGTLVSTKKASLVTKKDNVYYLNTSHRAKSADEVINAESSVAVRRLAGG